MAVDFLSMGKLLSTTPLEMLTDYFEGVEDIYFAQSKIREYMKAWRENIHHSAQHFLFCLCLLLKTVKLCKI